MRLAVSAILLLLPLFAAPQTPPSSPAAPGDGTMAIPAAITQNADCLKCHEPVQEQLRKKVVHAAVEAGCETCHADHRKAKSQIVHNLNEPQPGLCATCHDTKDKQLTAAHRGQPFDKAICTSCHDPHSSNTAKLIREQAHGPFAARQCESCHQPPEGSKVRLAAASTNALCLRCHEEFATRLVTAKVKHGLDSNKLSCTDCHDPHATNNERHLNKPLPSLCLNCHTAVTANRQFIHEPLKTSCVFCHDAHASDYPQRLRADVNRVCLECHAADAARRLQKTPVALFNGRVVLPRLPFPELKLLPVRSDERKGHPLPGHPVQAPASATAPEISCIACHRPHAANGSEKRFVTETAKATDLCTKCHK